MVTIIPRAEERLQIRPLADVRREERAPNTGGAVAEAQYKLGRTVASEALSFGELAIQKQEQVDRIELAKIKALRDSELKSVLLEEERNPDYEGMDGRIISRMKKYDDDLRKGVNGRLLKYVDPMIETEGAKLVPVLQGMYLKKQDDHASATALEAINQFIQNNDWASADATVDGMSWMDESQRAKLKIDIANKRQAYELTVNAQAEAQELLTEYGVDGEASAVEALREKYAGSDEDTYVSYAKSLFGEARQAQKETKNQSYLSLFDAVMSRNGSYAGLKNTIEQQKDVLGIDLYWNLRNALDSEFERGKYAPKTPKTPVFTVEETIAVQNLHDEIAEAAKEAYASDPQTAASVIGERYGNTLEQVYGVKAAGKVLSNILNKGRSKAAAGGPKSLFNTETVVRQIATDNGVTQYLSEQTAFSDEWLKACEARAKKEGRGLTDKELVEVGREMVEDRKIGPLTLGKKLMGGSAPTAKEYQLRSKGAVFNEKIQRWVTIKDGQTYILGPEDFQKLKPPTGEKKQNISYSPESTK